MDSSGCLKHLKADMTQLPVPFSPLACLSSECGNVIFPVAQDRPMPESFLYLLSYFQAISTVLCLKPMRFWQPHDILFYSATVFPFGDQHGQTLSWFCCVCVPLYINICCLFFLFFFFFFFFFFFLETEGSFALPRVSGTRFFEEA